MVEKKEPLKVKIIDMFLNARIWVLIIFIIMSFVSINPQFNKDGVVINGVIPGSAADDAGIEFNSNYNPTKFEQILYLNDKKINNVDDYYNFLKTLSVGDEFKLITNKNEDGIIIKIPKKKNIVNNISLNYSNLNITNLNISDLNANNDVNFTKINKNNNKNISIKDLIGLSVIKKSNSNIRLGIELEGGSRLILQPIDNISDEDFDMLILNLQNRLDVYGASGTKVNKLEDAFSNEKFVIVESISSNKNDIFELISRQGKFEASIGNETVFTGDNVLQVFKDPQHSRFAGCSENEKKEWICRYEFLIEIDSNSVNKMFNITSHLNVVDTHLSKKLAFHLDGQQITELSIASTFKTSKVTNPQISVSGDYKKTRQKALDSAKKEVKFLQTILSTQSLPSELKVLQSYSISSSQGKELLSNASIVALISLLLVTSLVAIRYRHLFVFIAIGIALVSEVFIVFGIAAFMKLSIDLVAIGGLIAAIGTGVDDQIIITDEYFRDKNKNLSSKKKIKNALYIIMISYFTTVAAMIPLNFAGLKILQGFAFMIIIGVSVGVFITRPAYATMLRIITTTKKERDIEKEENFK